MSDNRELLTLMASDLAFAVEAGFALGYSERVQEDEAGRPYIVMEAYTDDGEVAGRYRVYVEFVQVSDV